MNQRPAAFLQMRVVQFATLLAFVSLLSLPGEAVAADYTEEQLETFKSNLAEGTKAYNQEKFETALNKYKAARNAIDEPRITYRIALTQEKLGRCADARRAYATFIEKSEADSGLQTQRQSARDKLESLRQQCPPRGTLSVTCTPDDTTVSVGDSSKACPAEFDLSVGTHQVTAQAEGHESVSGSVDIQQGETTDQKVVLEPTPSATKPTERPAWRTYGPWVTMATGAVLLGGGVITDASAVSRGNKLDSARADNDAQRIRQLRNEAQAARTRTWVFYGTGLAVAAGGAIWYVVDRPAPEQRQQSATIRPTIGPTNLGLHIRW